MKDHEQRISRIRRLLVEMEERCAETASLIEETARLRAQVQKALDGTVGWKTAGGFGGGHGRGQQRPTRSKDNGRRKGRKGRSNTSSGK